MSESRELLVKVAQLVLQLMVIGLGTALALPFVLILVSPFLGS